MFSELHSELFKFNAFSVFRFVGNEQRFELASSYYALKINYLAGEYQNRTPQYFIVFCLTLTSTLVLCGKRAANWQLADSKIAIKGIFYQTPITNWRHIVKAQN